MGLAIQQVEEWRPAAGYEGHYEVSSLGRVKSLARTLPHARYGQRRWPEIILKTTDNGTGHRVVSLWKDKKREKKFVHRLALEAFVGQAPEGCECCHRDDNPANNRLENLYWGTRADKMRDMVRNGKNFNAAKTHCKRGHEFTPDNLIQYSLRDGRRDCLACSKIPDRKAA